MIPKFHGQFLIYTALMGKNVSIGRNQFAKLRILKLRNFTYI